MPCDYFPYDRAHGVVEHGGLKPRCLRTHALLEDVSIAKLCLTWPFERVIEKAIENVPVAAGCLGWDQAQSDCITGRLGELRQSLLDNNPNINFYDLLTTDSDRWGGDILEKSCALQHDILLAYLYVPNRGSGRLPEIKDEIKDLFTVHHMLNHIGNSGKSLRYYHERNRDQDSDHEILMIKMARRLGVFEPFNNDGHATTGHAPIDQCSGPVIACIDPVIVQEGANGYCHSWDAGLQKWKCNTKPHYNCDLSGNPPTPTSFSDPCPG